MALICGTMFNWKKFIHLQFKKSTGRPKKKRNEEAGESSKRKRSESMTQKLSKRRMVIKCSKCKCTGHNVTSCTNLTSNASYANSSGKAKKRVSVSQRGSQRPEQTASQLGSQRSDQPSTQRASQPSI